MLLFLLAAQAVAPTTAPPMPPPIVRYPTITPVTVVPARPSAPPPPPPVPITVEVTVMADGRTIYHGKLRVAPGYRASVSEGMTQAPAVICPGARSWDSSERQMLNVELARADRNDRASPDRFMVTVGWTRPGPATACGPAGGRAVSLTDGGELGPGASVSFRGDGGLSVMLARR